MESFLEWSTVLQQIAGVQIIDLLAQYDAQKGCRPRWLCQGNDDGQASADEYVLAVLYGQPEPPDWLRNILQPYSFTMVSSVLLCIQ